MTIEKILSSEKRNLKMRLSCGKLWFVLIASIGYKRATLINSRSEATNPIIKSRRRYHLYGDKKYHISENLGSFSFIGLSRLIPCEYD
jgi:hypothetical protein